MQAGAFRTKQNADDLVARLKQAGHDAFVFPITEAVITEIKTGSSLMMSRFIIDSFMLKCSTN
ncbi:SPOR domain-containing protein [Bacillus sp. SL00103]